MNNILVILNGEKVDVNFSDYDYIVAVDGGYHYLKEKNIKVDLYVGDSDSFCEKVVADKIIKLNTEKDETDFKAFINYIAKYEYHKCDIFCGTGQRLDHFYAIVQDLKDKMYLYDNQNKIYVKNKDFDVVKTNYKYISFFAKVKNVKITLEGFKYNVSNKNLNLGDTTYISNEILEIGKVKIDNPIIVFETID